MPCCRQNLQAMQQADPVRHKMVMDSILDIIS